MTPKKRPVDGVLLFDKPLHLSSNTALQKVRRLFRAEKAGHTGTLDPLATGLLPVCFGEATKFSGVLLDASKTYRAWVRLGQTTTTGDAEGEIVSERPVSADEAQVHAAMQELSGEIDQLPPMHSALKHQGKPLYEYIRKGETVARETRRVTIHELTLEYFAGNELRFTVHCSKGTYVRTLAEDIGELLGCGAHLTGLRRLAIAHFNLAHAHTMEQLEAMAEQERDSCILPIESLMPGIAVMQLDAEQARRMAQGQRLALDAGMADGLVRLHGPLGFIGLGMVQGHRLAPERLVASVARTAASSQE